jgi:hypothetical protein
VVATSTQPCEGQGQVPSATPGGPGSAAGHTIKSQFAFATLPGNGSAPMRSGGPVPVLLGQVVTPPPSDHEPVHLLKEECMPDFVGVVNQGIARPEDSYV